MRTLLYRVFLLHWPRKLVAFATALVIWVLVNHSITTSRIISNIPVRVVQIPQDKTIDGLLPDGTLSRRVTLTLRGAKTTLDALDPADVEIVLDASGKGDEWVADISKKNLVSLNPELDLLHNIGSVAHTEFVIKLSRLVTAKIPVYIPPPTGEAPQGYQFLGFWPTKLSHTLSGPEAQLNQLQAQGLELRFDLADIGKEELDRLEASEESAHEDEVHFPIPPSWKKIAIPFLENVLEPINDPEAQNLRAEFLRQELIPLDRALPISVFYPTRFADTVNPNTYGLLIQPPVNRIRGSAHLDMDLYIRNVSRLFLDVVKEYLVIHIIAAPKRERENLQWTLQVIAPKELEDIYFSRLENTIEDGSSRMAEEHIRKRFRRYLKDMELYVSAEEKLQLAIALHGTSITVAVPGLPAKRLTP